MNPKYRFYIQVITASLSLALWCGNAQAQRSNQDPLPFTGYHWVAVFGASPSDPTPTAQNTPNLAGYTCRQVVHIGTGYYYGLRFRLSNALSTTPLTLKDMHLALWAGSATNHTSAIVPNSDLPVTFGNGQTSVTIPSGGEVITDAIAGGFAPQTDLAVSFYIPAGSTTACTQHSLASNTVFFAPGDVSASTSFSTPGSYYSRPVLTSVEVAAPNSTAAIVTLGDSITDGAFSTVDGNTRWPDDLTVRLQAKYGPSLHGVVNAGIGGNGLISDLWGPNAVARLNRDVIAVPGVKYLIVYEGINDIGNNATKGLTADQMIAGYRAIIARAHEANIYVYGGTILPYQGASYYSAAGESIRQAVNTFIRTSGAFDAVIDFDKALADPKTPTQMLSTYDSGDHLHPGNAGLQAMANAIDLSLFDPNTH